MRGLAETAALVFASLISPVFKVFLTLKVCKEIVDGVCVLIQAAHCTVLVMRSHALTVTEF